jgi:hypothetical protein
MLAPIKRFAVTPIHLRVDGASLDLTKPLERAADATINGRAVFKADGSVTPQPLAADADVLLQKASLQILQPYILPCADLTIRDGLLNVVGKLRATPPNAKGPLLSFTGDVKVSDFKSADNALKQDLVNFRGRELQKLRYEHAPDALSIDRILIAQPFARVSISREQALNVITVYAPGDSAAKVAPAGVQPSTTASALVPRKFVASAPSQPNAKTLPIQIREVRVTDGRLSFSDASVQPNFAANVFALNGAVTGLSSAPASRATVDLKGRVDEFSPVLISGSIQPFAYDRFTDIGMKFQNISLPVLNPYSGRHAGYTIAKGKLGTTFHDLVQDRKLTATHKIRIDQLEWGDATTGRDPGTAALDTASAERLAALARELVEKSELKLDVPIGTVAELDRPALAESLYVQQLGTATALALGRKPEDKTPLPDFNTLPPKQRLGVLGALVRQQGGVAAPVSVPPAGSASATAAASRGEAARRRPSRRSRPRRVPPSSCRTPRSAASVSSVRPPYSVRCSPAPRCNPSGSSSLSPEKLARRATWCRSSSRSGSSCGAAGCATPTRRYLCVPGWPRQRGQSAPRGPG